MSFLAKNSGCSGELSSPPVILESVSAGLHRAAQPLAVLHGMLEHALLDIPAAEEYRKVLVQLKSEVHRLTTSFDDLRETLRLAESALQADDKLDVSPGKRRNSKAAALAKTEHNHV